MQDIKPKNPKIKISELGEEKTFVSGNKNYRLEWAQNKKVRFEVGDTVKWFDKDAKSGEKRIYEGKIKWLIIVDNGSVEVATDMPLGRLDLEEIKLIKKAKKN